MAFLMMIMAVAYLAGVATAVSFVMVLGIRQNDRPERITNPGSSRSAACARRVLRSGTWPDIPVYRDTSEDD